MGGQNAPILAKSVKESGAFHRLSPSLSRQCDAHVTGENIILLGGGQFRISFLSKGAINDDSFHAKTDEQWERVKEKSA